MKLLDTGGSVRSKYKAFDPGLKSTSTDVYKHEIPGGQYSNLYNQAEKVGVTTNEFFELTQRYKEVNNLLGNIAKSNPFFKSRRRFCSTSSKKWSNW